MSQIVSIKKLLECGVHIGHNTRKWDARMRPYIYIARNSVYILDLSKTQEAINNAYKALMEISANGGKVLFVGTKKTVEDIIKIEALRSNSYYVNHRWLGGLLTNFKTIQKRIERLVEIKDMEASERLGVYTKKEVAKILKEKHRLESFLGGIKDMKKLPDAIFITNPLEEHIAVLEARKLNIPIFAICDTNANPDLITYPIPANDDAVKSVQLITTIVANAILDPHNGVLETVDENPENTSVTMNEVIRNIDEIHAENERRRRERIEEKRRLYQQLQAEREQRGEGGEERRPRYSRYRQERNNPNNNNPARPRVEREEKKMVAKEEKPAEKGGK